VKKKPIRKTKRRRRKKEEGGSKRRKMEKRRRENIDVMEGSISSFNQGELENPEKREE